MKESKVKEFFLFSWKKFCLVITASFISIVLHNLISGLIGSEEAFFFIIVIFIIPAYILVALLFNLINYFRKKCSNSIW
ncbi:hypothetical protein ACFL15_00475 [Patescibacteria group bacterium]